MISPQRQNKWSQECFAFIGGFDYSYGGIYRFIHLMVKNRLGALYGSFAKRMKAVD
jgi:hypothetical protein